MSVRVGIWGWQTLEFLTVFMLLSHSSSLTVDLCVTLMIMVALRLIIIGALTGFVALFWATVPLTPRLYLRYWLGEFWAFLFLYFGLQAVPSSWVTRNIDVKARHVILVHGFFCNNGFWWLLSKYLIANGYSVSYVEMPELFGSLNRFSEYVAEEVERIEQHYPETQIQIVSFSMGGLAVRDYLSRRVNPVYRHIAIFTPSQGIFMAFLPALLGGRNAIEMKPGSRWLSRLKKREESLNRPDVTVNLWTTHDSIIIPPPSGEPLGRSKRLIGKGHLSASIDGSVHHIIGQLLAE